MGLTLDRRVHKYQVDPATGITKLVETKPFRTMIAKGRPTVHFQAGHYFYDSGELIPDPEITALGFDLDTVPTGMKPSPEVTKVLNEGSAEALKEWAYEMKGGPKRGRK